MPPGVKDLCDGRKLREMERMFDVERRARLPHGRREAEDIWAALGLSGVVGLTSGCVALTLAGIAAGLIVGAMATYAAYRFFAWVAGV